MKYKYRMLIAAALAGGIYFFLFYISPFDGTISLSEMILQLSGSRGSFALGFSYAELVPFAMKQLPALIFEMGAGIMLYRHFCTASIYVFSRYPHRIKWYIREVCRLGSAVCLFYVFLLAAVITATAFCYELQIDSAGMILAVYHLFIHGLWVYSMTLTVNLLALYLGSSTAYALVVGVQMVFVVILNVMDLIVRRLADGTSYQKILIWNPVAHLVLGWHSSKMETVNQVLTPMYLQTDLDNSLVLFLLFGVSVTYAGAVIIKKHDFLISYSKIGRA